jgi:hypothetical protein
MIAMTEPTEWALDRGRNLAAKLREYLPHGWNEDDDETVAEEIADAIDAARRQGREDAARWHEEQVEMVMDAKTVTQNRGIADIHEKSAAEIRALP